MGENVVRTTLYSIPDSLLPQESVAARDYVCAIIFIYRTMNWEWFQMYILLNHPLFLASSYTHLCVLVSRSQNLSGEARVWYTSYSTTVMAVDVKM